MKTFAPVKAAARAPQIDPRAGSSGLGQRPRVSAIHEILHGPVLQCKPCKGSDHPGGIIFIHDADPYKIEKPGDSITFDVRFNCDVLSWNSIIEKADSTSLDLEQPKTQTTDRFTRTWDGMKHFKGVRNYLVDDGDYRHRLENVKFGYKYNPATKKSDDVYATGSNLISPTIFVRARKYHGPGVEHHHSNEANENLLADIIKSEMGLGTDEEKKALAWAVRNQMLRLNTASVETARDIFQDAYRQASGDGERNIAKDILKRPLSEDTTSGSIKWFSPRSMPKKGESCKGMDCGAGLITVKDDTGTDREVYAPSWHLTMNHVNVAGAREWYVRFYSLR